MSSTYLVRDLHPLLVMHSLVIHVLTLHALFTHQAFVQALARRPAGRAAILELPCVVRAITSGKREVRKKHSLRRGNKLASLAAAANANAARAKGEVTSSRLPFLNNK